MPLPLLTSMNSCKAEPGISSRTELLVWLVAEEFSRCRESIIQLFPEESRNEIKLFLEYFGGDFGLEDLNVDRGDVAPSASACLPATISLAPQDGSSATQQKTTTRMIS